MISFTPLWRKRRVLVVVVVVIVGAAVSAIRISYRKKVYTNLVKHMWNGIKFKIAYLKLHIYELWVYVRICTNGNTPILTKIIICYKNTSPVFNDLEVRLN